MGISVVILTCANPACGKEFTKRLAEFNRSERVGRQHFCSLSCFARTKGLDNFKDKRNTSTAHLRTIINRDDFSPFRNHLRRIKSCAKEKNKEVSVTLENLKFLWENQKGICPYTGWKLVLLPCTTDYECTPLTPNRASVDRKDSSRGYTVDNIHFVAVIANYAKNAFTEQELLEFCNDVTRFREFGGDTQVVYDSLGINNFGNLSKPTAALAKNLGIRNSRDEYSRVRQHHRLARRRVKGIKGRSLECTITLQELKEQWEKQGGCCPYTGWKLDNPATTNGWNSHILHPRQASLDRIDSSLGYLPGNVQFVAIIANYAKNKFTESELLNFCKAVVDKRQKKH